MWKYFACLRGHHTYHVRVQPGLVFLECICCGRRTHGWNLTARSATRARQTLRLLLDESAMSQTRPVKAPPSSESRRYPERLAASNEFRLHLELSGPVHKRMDREMGQQLRKVLQLVGSDRPR